MSDKTLTMPEHKEYLPGFEIWGREHNTLKLIGTDEHELDNLHKVLGLTNSRLLDNFSVTDEAEIAARQEMTKDLFENREFRNMLEQLVIDHGRLTENGHEFLRIYAQGKNNRFWSMVDSFLAKAPKGSGLSSRRIAELRDVLSDSGKVRDAEYKAADTMRHLVEGMVVAQGQIDLDCYFWPNATPVVDYSGLQNFTAYKRWFVGGYNLFKNPPDWVKTKSDSWIFRTAGRFASKAISYYNLLKTVNARRASDVTKKVENCLIRHIRQYFREKILEAYKNTDDKPKLSGHFKFNILVTHGGRGTQFQVMKISSVDHYQTGENSAISHMQPYPVDFPLELWPLSFQEGLRDLMDSRDNLISDANQWIRISELGILLTKGGFDVIGTHKCGSDWLTPGEVIIPELSDVWEDNCVRKVIQTVSAFRKQTVEYLADLKDLARLVSRQIEIASKHSVPICIPEQISNGHVVAFDSLAPIHVLNHPKVKKVYSFRNLEPLGGRIISMIGDHAAGKTTFSIALPQLICQAQSGTFVFGENVKWSMRDTIGLVILEKHKGDSTMVGTGETIADMLRLVRTMPREKLLLVFDELGSGTDGENEPEFAVPIFRVLKKAGVDLCVTTQSERVAKLAVNEYGATGYHINRDHEITVGIRRADIGLLMEETGLNAEIKALEDSLNAV